MSSRRRAVRVFQEESRFSTKQSRTETQGKKVTIMEKKLLCVVLIMLLMVSFNSAQPNQRIGKRNFQAVIKKREYCARARQICSPTEDDVIYDGHMPDVYP